VKYELKLPENSPLKPEHVEQIAAFAKEHGLSPAAAQAIVERDSNAVTAFRKAELDAYQQQAAGWQQAVKSDPEMGGSDERVAETATLSNRVVTQYGTPELKKLFADTSLGNHPELTRIFARLGKAIGNDRFVNPPTNQAAPKKKSDAELFYGTPPKTT
jgi:hypothetical protein